MSKLTLLRLILIVLAVGLVAIPMIIVSITDRGFGEWVSHTLISLSILSLIGAIMLGADKKDKNKLLVKAYISIALLIVLASVWI